MRSQNRAPMRFRTIAEDIRRACEEQGWPEDKILAKIAECEQTAREQGIA